jgi:hypothetical protein
VICYELLSNSTLVHFKNQGVMRNNLLVIGRLPRREEPRNVLARTELEVYLSPIGIKPYRQGKRGMAERFVGAKVFSDGGGKIYD